MITTGIMKLLMYMVQEVPVPEKFWHVDMGNFLTITVIVVQALFFLLTASRHHGENQQQIKELIVWKNEHMLDASQRDDAIKQLEKTATHLESIASGVKEQLEIMREDMRDLRRRNG